MAVSVDVWSESTTVSTNVRNIMTFGVGQGSDPMKRSPWWSGQPKCSAKGIVRVGALADDRYECGGGAAPGVEQWYLYSFHSRRKVREPVPSSDEHLEGHFTSPSGNRWIQRQRSVVRFTDIQHRIHMNCQAERWCLSASPICKIEVIRIATTNCKLVGGEVVCTPPIRRID